MDDKLNNLYRDLFGPSDGTNDQPAEPPKTSEKTENPADPAPSTGAKPAAPSTGSKPVIPVTRKPKYDEEKAIRDAQDILKQVRDFMGSELDALNAQVKNDAKKGDRSKEDSRIQDPKMENPKEAAAPQEAEKEATKEPERDPMEQLEELIGLTAIKHDVRELTDFVQVQTKREEMGLKSVPVSLHLVFTGNPGTGKTTVARILASLYKKIGVLSQGQLVEVDRSGLVAGYVGQTAIKTQKKIEEAMGGILFIDEAYALSQKDDPFGQEAIDTILKAMEDHRKDFAVIVAGYTDPMEDFINSNPGLKSRFNKYLEFPDYSVDELEKIFLMNCKKYDYKMSEDTQRAVRELIKLRKLKNLENFANAREVRNLFEEIITNQARRLAAMENPKNEDLMTIEIEDLRDDEADKKTPEAAAEREASGIKTPELSLEPAKEPEEEPAEGPNEEPAEQPEEEPAKEPEEQSEPSENQ